MPNYGPWVISLMEFITGFAFGFVVSWMIIWKMGNSTPLKKAVKIVTNTPKHKAHKPTQEKPTRQI